MLGNVYVLIDDKNKSGYTKTLYQEEVENFQTANRKGRGIYCSVNDFEATEEQMKEAGVSTKRNIQFLSKINAVFADIDIAKKGDNQTREEKEAKKEKLILEINLKLPPSIIINTSNGIQPLWRLKDQSVDIKYQAEYVGAINGIINRSKTVGGAGDAVKDVTRVIRVPGYYHMKEEPYKITKTETEGLEYTLEEVIEAFKEWIPQPVPFTNLYQPSGQKIVDTNLQYQQIESLDFVDVVTKAFNSVGRSCEVDNKGRLIIDGRLTGNFIGKRGDKRYLASTSHEEFKGNIVSGVASILGTSSKEAYKWIIDAFDIKPLSEIKKEVQKVEKKQELEKSVVSNFRHISYAEKIASGYEELVNTDPNKVMKRGRDERDNMLGGIYGGKIYLIGANTGVGKTTFVNQVCRNVSRAGNRVVKYSLEDRMQDSAKEELYYEVNRLRHGDKKPSYMRTKFVNNEYRDSEFEAYLNKAGEVLVKENIIELEKTKQVNIDELILLMEEECKNGTRLFVIDHLHYFERDTSTNKERLDLHIQNVMHNINEIARKHDVAILLVAHYRNNTNIKPGEIPDNSWFKDGASIKQVANVIIQIERNYETETSYFYITKLRGPIKPEMLDTEFDLALFEYTFKKSSRQIEAEAVNFKAMIEKK